MSQLETRGIGEPPIDVIDVNEVHDACRTPALAVVELQRPDLQSHPLDQPVPSQVGKLERLPP